MKELKFRVWIERYKKYMPISLIDFEPISGKIVCVKVVATGGDWSKFYPEEVILEQYTGLKDKNGREIYEGDILGDMWGDGYIAWCDKCKQLQYHISTHECMACLGDVQWYELVNDNGKLEVIGNIHKNKELLEEE